MIAGSVSTALRPHGWSASATGGAVELFPQDVCVPGMPGGLARHMGHDPAERVPVALDRDGDTCFWIAQVMDRAIALRDRLLVILHHVGHDATGRNRHAIFGFSVQCGADEVVAEPVPLRLRQVLYQTDD